MKYKINQKLIAKEAVYKRYNKSFIIGKEYEIKKLDEYYKEYHISTEHSNRLFFFTDKNIDLLFYTTKENELWI